MSDSLAGTKAKRPYSYSGNHRQGAKRHDMKPDDIMALFRRIGWIGSR